MTGNYLDHRFDLLGSGWVVVRHGMSCAGLEGHRHRAGPAVRPDPDGAWLEGRVTAANLAESQRIWRLVEPGYDPIDWHLDFKSGWRWSELAWYRDIAFGSVPGADVKVPWELARMQHLPQLALAAALSRAGESGLSSPERYASEFRNEVLDFIATNPPRFGVNWTTTMDVAIRVANWLVAHDLFLAAGATFDPAFEAIFARSVLEHAGHIAANLEGTAQLRANHYLADIVGLLFAAAYLPRGDTTDAWLTFAALELLAEGRNQFNEDGSNVEASTCYHRLSAEMVTYGAALLQGLVEDKAAARRDHDLRPIEGLACRLERMAEFTIDLTKPDGHVCQIGDNDNGRFLKLAPSVRRMPVAAARERFASLAGYAALPDDATYWVEDHLDHRQLVGAIGGLVARPDFARVGAGAQLESTVVADLAKGARFPGHRTDDPTSAAGVRVGDDEGLAAVETWLAARTPDQRRTQRIDLNGSGATKGLALAGYPDFGVYVIRSDRVYIAVRCGPVGRHGLGGHAHNDQLGIELSVDGEAWIRDPGTYLYTPLPEQRDAYRSAGAHYLPAVDGREPAELGGGPFRLGRGSAATCLYWGPMGFAGRLRMVDARTLVLRLRLEDDHLGLDYGIEGSRFAVAGDAAWDHGGYMPHVPFSPGYGILERDGRW